MFELLFNLPIFHILMKIMFIVCIFVLLILTLLFFFQNHLIYIPSFGKMVPQKMEDNPHGFRSPTEKGLDYKNVYIKTSDNIRLHGWFVFSSSTQIRLGATIGVNPINFDCEGIFKSLAYMYLTFAKC